MTSSRAWRTLRTMLGGACVLWPLAACKPKVSLGQDPQAGAQPPGGETRAGSVALAERGLTIVPCRTADGVLALSGAWVFELETVSVVSGGNLVGEQTEVVTRFGIAQLCQDATEVTARLLMCGLAQSRLKDDSQECAAQMPGVAVLTNLEETTLSGTLDRDDFVGGGLTLGGWRETWGLAADASPPATDASPGDDALEDSDDDGDPGVTLSGDGEVPTVAWAVRLTEGSLALQVEDERSIGGVVRSETTERIIGGPAARVLSGRTRVGGEGRAIFRRADGRFRSPKADTDGDDVLSCAELAPLIGDFLPAPRNDTCGG